MSNLPIDKTAMRRGGENLRFILMGHPADFSVILTPKPGDGWGVTIFDHDRFDDVCHVETIQCDSTNPLDVLHVALGAFIAHRGPAPVHGGAA